MSEPCSALRPLTTAPGHVHGRRASVRSDGLAAAVDDCDPVLGAAGDYGVHPGRVAELRQIGLKLCVHQRVPPGGDLRNSFRRGGGLVVRASAGDDGADLDPRGLNPRPCVEHRREPFPRHRGHGVGVLLQHRGLGGHQAGEFHSVGIDDCARDARGGLTRPYAEPTRRGGDGDHGPDRDVLRRRRGGQVADVPLRVHRDRDDRFAGQGRQTRDLGRGHDEVGYQDVAEAGPGEHLGLPESGNRDSADGASGGDLPMGYRGGVVRVDPRTKAGHAAADGTVHRPYVRLQDVQVDDERRCVKVVHGRARRFEYRSFQLSCLTLRCRVVIGTARRIA